MKNSLIKNYVMLHILLLFYSFCGVFSKLAAQSAFLTLGFFALYGCMISVLFIYAICWQQVLKKIPLTIAFCNKAVTVVWAMIWGKLFFNETISIMKIVGTLIVLIGICLVVSCDE